MFEEFGTDIPMVQCNSCEKTFYRSQCIFDSEFEEWWCKDCYRNYKPPEGFFDDLLDDPPF